MNQTELLLLEDLLDKEIGRLTKDLRKNAKHREIWISTGRDLFYIDRQKQSLEYRLEVANETLTKLTEWSNN